MEDFTLTRLLELPSAEIGRYDNWNTAGTAGSVFSHIQINEVFNLLTSSERQANNTRHVYQKYFRKLAKKFFEFVSIMLIRNLAAVFNKFARQLNFQ
jgi:hypothetical protein